MREEESKYNQLPEIIDVQPIAVEPVMMEPKQEEELFFNFELREEEQENNFVESPNRGNETKADEPSPSTEDQTYKEQETEINTYTEGTYRQSNKTKQTEEAKAEDRDTSFGAFKENQYASERSWRKRTGSKMKKIIFWIVALLIGMPFFGAAGAALVFGAGFGVFFTGATLIAGIIGLGVGAFGVTAQLGAIGPVIIFMSIAAVGGGGLGLLLILAILIFIKNKVMMAYRNLKMKYTEGEQ